MRLVHTKLGLVGVIGRTLNIVIYLNFVHVKPARLSQYDFVRLKVDDHYISIAGAVSPQHVFKIKLVGSFMQKSGYRR